MEYGCYVRFAKWFAHHLSNFEFRFDWAPWIPAVTANPTGPQAYVASC